MYHASNDRTTLKIQYHMWLTNLPAGQPTNQLSSTKWTVRNVEIEFKIN